MFLRGLIHSPGCRVTNKVWGGKYEYPRYFFTNHSLDIQQLFKDACDPIGLEYKNKRRPPRRDRRPEELSVSRP
jgi:hypothetical protein